MHEQIAAQPEGARDHGRQYDHLHPACSYGEGQTDALLQRSADRGHCQTDALLQRSADRGHCHAVRVRRCRLFRPRIQADVRHDPVTVSQEAPSGLTVRLISYAKGVFPQGNAPFALSCVNRTNKNVDISLLSVKYAPRVRFRQIKMRT